MRNNDIEIKSALIVVRTYPSPEKKGVEVSCTAAITDKGEWLCLFPVPYRRLHTSQRFHKYQWIDIGVTRASDPRPESHRIDQETIKIKSAVLSSASAWKARKDIVYPLESESMCALQRKRDQDSHPTLGIFKPAEIKRLAIKPTSPNWTAAELEIMRQGDLFESELAEELEKIPFDFSYEFRCNDAECLGHKMKCTDWEMGQSWRKWRTVYGDSWEGAFRQKYEHDMIEKYDTVAKRASSVKRC